MTIIYIKFEEKKRAKALTNRALCSFLLHFRQWVKELKIPLYFEIKKGDVIGQVVFQKYLVVDNDNATGDRIGGFGSTDKKQIYFYFFLWYDIKVFGGVVNIQRNKGGSYGKFFCVRR